MPQLTIAHWWLVAIIGAFVAGLLIFAHAAVLLLGAFRADQPTDAPEADIESVSREALQETISMFEARLKAYERITMRRGGGQ